MYKTLLTLLLVPLCVSPAAWAQDRIYRCGNEYTNNASQARERGCKLVEGGNVTVLGTSGSRAAVASGGAGGGNAAAAGGATATSPASAPKVDSNAQRARDADARSILESELRKAEARQAEVAKEYNNGAPERNALDLRNPQRYIERTAELKSSLARAESDVAGIKRELSRLPAPTN
jgi:hypothetical protein